MTPRGLAIKIAAVAIVPDMRLQPRPAAETERFRLVRRDDEARSVKNDATRSSGRYWP
jgi:hypothetical protein